MLILTTFSAFFVGGLVIWLTSLVNRGRRSRAVPPITILHILYGMNSHSVVKGPGDGDRSGGGAWLIGELAVAHACHAGDAQLRLRELHHHPGCSWGQASF